ncbi:hypothetical protein K3495_g192 [Podosphaera aphanis]|nr:hypothetical protein K3495_g192 [Podosphaera aphanis]
MTSASIADLAPTDRIALDPYLPIADAAPPVPHLTLTYAASLDSAIAQAAGSPTLLSGPETKAMTHYLRTRHDAILVGAGTALADNPKLISRCVAVRRQPRPVVLDPSGRWLHRFDGSDHLSCLARAGLGLPPWVVVDAAVASTSTAAKLVRDAGGRVLTITGYKNKSEGVDWNMILAQMAELGIHSVMVEGGSCVINDLLRLRNRYLIASVIVTIAPTYLGAGGVQVSHPRDTIGEVAIQLKDVRWLPMGKDVVMAGLP